MPTIFTGPPEYEPINETYFSLLKTQAESFGFHLSPKDILALEDFFLKGANKLSAAKDKIKYKRDIAKATNKLIERFKQSVPGTLDMHGGMKAFLKFLCPIDPFC